MERRPLVLIDGNLQELPVGDSLTGMPVSSGGATWVEFSFRYTKANPTYPLPAGTISVPQLYDEAGINIVRDNRRLDLLASPPTLTILGGPLENDLVEGAAWVRSPSTPDPNPDPDPNPSGSTSYATATYDTLIY